MNQEESEQNEVDGMKKRADSTGKGDAYVKERLVICNGKVQMVEHGFYMTQTEQRSGCV